MGKEREKERHVGRPKVQRLTLKAYNAHSFRKGIAGQVPMQCVPTDLITRLFVT